MLFFFFSLTPLFLLGSTCTWTGANSTVWQEGGNWNTGNIPTATDDVIIPDVPNLPVLIIGSINIKSLSIAKSLNLMAPPNLSFTFTANSITLNNTSNNFADAQIIGFSSVTVSNITLNGLSSDFVSFTIQNATINGSVNSNSQDLVFTGGTTTLNNGCSFSGNAYTNGVRFSSTALNVNGAINLSCKAQFPTRTISGSGSLTFINDGRPSFGSTGLGVTTIQVPITINNTVTDITPPINCGNVIFENTV